MLTTEIVRLDKEIEEKDSMIEHMTLEKAELEENHKAEIDEITE